MTILAKLTAAVLLLLSAGLPILETWEALAVTACLLALTFSAVRPGAPRRLAVAAAITLAVVGAKAILPRADIAEAHNAFLVVHDGEPLEQGLPPQVFQSWRAQFNALYPPDDEPYDARSPWRTAGAPRVLSTQSADAIWRPAKYTRQVDAIDFQNLGEFRGGFANDNQYNFWAGELRRESMPFYVMYELTPASVGSRIAWQGQVFWEQADGAFAEITHADMDARQIGPSDVGRRVYAAFFPKRDPVRRFRLEPSLGLRASRWLHDLLTIIGVGSVVFLTVRPRWRSLLRALSIVSVGYVLTMSFITISAGKYLGRAYPPQGGGDDGLVHDGRGHVMALAAGDGYIGEALRGLEDVYWFTPGTRYVRMVEKLMFGDTNFLFALVVVLIPLVLFYLIRHFAGSRWAWGVTGMFWLMPVGNLSFLAQIANAKLGYGDTIGGGFFMLALVLMLRNQPAWGGSVPGRWEAWAGGAALAASMFIRPNLAFAVVWMGAGYAWASWQRKDLGGIAIFAFGLGLALWMPAHNWVYGGEFYLISKSGATISVPVGVGDYATALGDVLRGHGESPAATMTGAHLKGWLWDPGLVVRGELRPLAWGAHVVKLAALLVTCGIALRWMVRRFDGHPGLPVVAVASLLAHLPMLFVFATQYRYAMLAWDLTLVVLIVWLAGLTSPRPRQVLAGI
jgi:hypothetical protein